MLPSYTCLLLSFLTAVDRCRRACSVAHRLAMHKPHSSTSQHSLWLPCAAGTMRLQLENKGDNDHTLTNFGNIVVAFAFVTIPVIGWLLDKKVR